MVLTSAFMPCLMNRALPPEEQMKVPAALKA
jgi:hypothetical protein